MINDIAFVAYSVRDLAKAVAFYRDVLGLQAGEPFGDRYAEFNVGSGVFAIDADPPGYEPGTCSGVNFEVDDIVASREKLVQKPRRSQRYLRFSNLYGLFRQRPGWKSLRPSPA